MVCPYAGMAFTGMAGMALHVGQRFGRSRHGRQGKAIMGLIMVCQDAAGMVRHDLEGAAGRARGSGHDTAGRRQRAAGLAGRGSQVCGMTRRGWHG